MSIATEFAARVKRVREARGFSIPDLADMCNLTPQSIVSTEKGNSSPNFMALVLMARALDVSIDYLCLGMVGQSFKHTQKELV